MITPIFHYGKVKEAEARIEAAKVKLHEMQGNSPMIKEEVDELVMFTPLNETEIQQIVRIQLSSIMQQLETQGVKLEVTDKAIQWIADVGFDPQFGARPVKRALQRHLLNELSKQLLSGSIDISAPILVDVQNGQLSFGKK
jgi:ATP-dependent Clp protease ATP-binding subunit ClpB